jgi:hypothetical protein
MYRLHIMHPSNPRDERRHYPIILQGFKHIGVMETPENVVDEDGGDEAWELLTPKFGKESDLWVQLSEKSIRWKEGFFRCIRQKIPRSAICFRSAKELLS